MHHSTVATRLLGTATLITAALLPACVYFRYGAPRPRWDMVGIASAALVLAVAWVWASWRAPKAVFGGTPVADSVAGEDVPEIPAVLHKPRRPWVFAAGSLLLAWSLLALVMVFALPNGSDQKVVTEVRNAGATVAKGTVEEPKHVVMTDDGESTTYVTRHGRRYYRTTHHTPTWHADLVMRVPGPDSTELVQIKNAMVSRDPAHGASFTVLYAPSRPDLGGLVNDRQDLSSLIPSWGLPGIAWLVLLGIAAALVLYATVRVGTEPFDTDFEKMRADAAAGRVHASRVRVGRAVWAKYRSQWLELELPDLTLRFSSHSDWSPIRRRELLGVSGRFGGKDAWLCWPLGFNNNDTKSVAVLVLDDGQAVWGYMRGQSAEDNDFRLPRTYFETSPARTTRAVSFIVSRYRPSEHLPKIAGLAVAFLAVLPVLLAPLSLGAAGGLCLLSAILTIAACYPRFFPYSPAEGWTFRPDEDA